MRLIDIDDHRNCYIGMDGEYEQWNIDPNVLSEAQPEIIRCKDCRHCDLGCDDDDNQYYSCTVRFDEDGFWNEVEAEDFCSWAGRRSDDRDKRQ